MACSLSGAGFGCVVAVGGGELLVVMPGAASVVPFGGVVTPLRMTADESTPLAGPGAVTVARLLAGTEAAPGTAWLGVGTTVGLSAGGGTDCGAWLGCWTAA